MSARESAADPGSHRLIFRWPERSASFVLPTVFVASVLVHAIAFYVFQVEYRDPVSIAPPPAQVTYLPPWTPQNESVLRWIESRDPAIAGAVKTVVPQGLGDIEYKPSYASSNTHPVPVAESDPQVSFLPVHNALALTEPHPQRAELPHGKVESSLTFSRALEKQAPAEIPEIPFTTKATTGLQNTVFLIAVTDRGELRYSFLQTSSGDRNIDSAADAALKQCNFQKSENPLTWGYATFNWGVEAYASPTPAPASTE
jgi:hypothetical protein